jgi:hypothetical protein
VAAVAQLPDATAVRLRQAEQEELLVFQQQVLRS